MAGVRPVATEGCARVHPSTPCSGRLHGPIIAGSFVFAVVSLMRLNKRLAVFITDRVGTMWCAYAFAALALVSLPEALASRDPLKIISWTAQTFLQLVLLPIIIVGQNIQSEIAERQAQTDSETLIAIKQLAEEIHEAAYKPSSGLMNADG